jgi:hypothetical protein
MHKWDQSRGEWSRDGVVLSRGYSGLGRGKNNPDMQEAKGVGPIPQGKWKIGAHYDSGNTGPFTIVLTPDLGTKTFGRSDFRIHGDSIKFPGAASHGCIILPRAMREKIAASRDTELLVVE